MPPVRALARDIDNKLRADFRDRLKEVRVVADTIDPVLAILFRTFSTELEALSLEAEQNKTSLLDELIARLDFANRSARPAQTIVKFFLENGSCVLEAGSELGSQAKNRERVTFTTDASVSVSTASITFAATYQRGALRVVPGVEWSESSSGGTFSLEPVSVNLGPSPAIILAIERLPEHHLGRLGLFFELSSYAVDVQRALLSENWCLAGPEGDFGARGILRPYRSNAGGRQLRWLIGDGEASGEESGLGGALGEAAYLPDGFYAGRNFIFPDIPPSRRFVCRAPRGMTSALAELVGQNADEFFHQERAWVRIAMPREILDLHSAIAHISLHTVSASNVETLNETVRFEKQATSVPVSREAGAVRFLVAPRSVIGENGLGYLPESEASTDPNIGRYSIRNGIMRLQPARYADHTDELANLRLWVTSGASGNGIEAGQIQTVLTKRAPPGLHVTNLTSAAGGTDVENFKDAHARFAHAILSRDRIVTRPDLTSAVRAFDRRIRDAELISGFKRDEEGLKRVQRLTVWLDVHDFHDPQEESRVLQDELGSYCRSRFVDDIGFVVDVSWK